MKLETLPMLASVLPHMKYRSSLNSVAKKGTCSSRQDPFFLRQCNSIFAVPSFIRRYRKRKWNQREWGLSHDWQRKETIHFFEAIYQFECILYKYIGCGGRKGMCRWWRHGNSEKTDSKIPSSLSPSPIVVWLQLTILHLEIMQIICSDQNSSVSSNWAAVT